MICGDIYTYTPTYLPIYPCSGVSHLQLKLICVCVCVQLACMHAYTHIHTHTHTYPPIQHTYPPIHPLTHWMQPFGIEICMFVYVCVKPVPIFQMSNSISKDLCWMSKSQIAGLWRRFPKMNLIL